MKKKIMIHTICLFKISRKWTNLVKNMGDSKIPIILASESPRRKTMLRELGIPFKSFHSRIDETLRFKNPEKAICDLALRKVSACNGKNGLIIGMDSMVIIGKNRLGKPADAAEAEKMLKLLSGKKHRVITGVAISFQDRIITESETTFVYFRKLKLEEIRWYIKSGEAFDKAGAYAIQGLARVFIKKIEGCYYNVLGFPIEAFQRILSRLGLSIYDLMKS
jgi:nucleoside triphosphate pyrophosphatase